ncbi:MAG: hypothetical protein CL558_10845 [Alphaproteobacteria bacterium]|nr:hypothetical protein [Alphaproteobacteria bacterium]MAS46013.1 hypothetical protein [Alphaproteobacteria bacterium]MAX95805.1 hypothetical protein [Alphaproteobacteria bacterium]MBN54061.1 hypothetical protein [Alphaproteobacteria bacterium]OUT42352.1 MAG: hypothetical protein CBB62_08740 [Micavibrio sp. TMED2]|tara:strand:+ start:2112 stop:3314 length:1203 start_codon:yes stop_codon:yes gene_type:complete
MTPPIIDNQRARRIFLQHHALAEQPTGSAKGEALADLVRQLGLVQIDSIATVERAHHMILRARSQSYRPDALAPLIERHRSLWEHWTHDASILPVELFPHWRHRFATNRETLLKRWTGWQRDGFHERFDDVLNRIADHGPVSAADVGKDENKSAGGWWDWHPSKAALEYLWHVGELAITRREGFRKVYDLTERVIPAPLLGLRHSCEETVDWACSSALDRLGFATPGELAAFWQAISIKEARDWCQAALARDELIEAQIEGWSGQLRRVIMRPATLETEPPAPPNRVRVLSPFDPALRDRKRAEYLFGFAYRIEIYVPAPKRQYGYYVFPVLEGDRIIGRLDAKAHRDEGVLRVTAFWPEISVKLGVGRLARLEAELERLARFARCDQIEFLPDWQRKQP